MHLVFSLLILEMSFSKKKKSLTHCCGNQMGIPEKNKIDGIPECYIY